MFDLVEDGLTVITASHQMGFANTAAHRVMFSDEGMPVEENEVDEFFDKPQHGITRLSLSRMLWRQVTTRGYEKPQTSPHG